MFYRPSRAVVDGGETLEREGRWQGEREWKNEWWMWVSFLLPSAAFKTSLLASHSLSSWVLKSLNTLSWFISVIHTHTGLLRSLNSEWTFFQTPMPLSSYAPVECLWFLSPPSAPISMSSSMQWSFSLNQFPAHILGVTIYWHCIVSTILSFNQSLWPQFPIILPELLQHSEFNYPLISSGFPILSLHFMV